MVESNDAGLRPAGLVEADAVLGVQPHPAAGHEMLVPEQVTGHAARPLVHHHPLQTADQAAAPVQIGSAAGLQRLWNDRPTTGTKTPLTGIGV